MADELRYRCVATLRGHTNNARACVLSNKASEQQSGAQDLCVAALPDGRVVSGSGDRTLKVWDVSRGRLVRTLRGHTDSARRRRPVEPIARRRRDGRRSGVSPPCRTTASCPGRGTTRSRCGTCREVGSSGRCAGTRTQRGAGVQSTQRVDRSSTQRRAQVNCVAALPNGRVVSGGGMWDHTLKVWDVSSGRCLRTLSGHTNGARRRRPVDTACRSLVDAATGAGQLRRRAVERPRRFWGWI